MAGDELNDPVFPPPLAGPIRAGKADALAGDKFRVATPAAAAVGEGTAEDGTASDGDSDICARAAATSLAALDGDSDGVANVSGDARPSALAPETTPIGCSRTMGACAGDSGIGMVKLPVDGSGGGEAFDCVRTRASCRGGAIAMALIVPTADASGAKKAAVAPATTVGPTCNCCGADECEWLRFAPGALRSSVFVSLLRCCRCCSGGSMTGEQPPRQTKRADWDQTDWLDQRPLGGWSISQCRRRTRQRQEQESQQCTAAKGDGASRGGEPPGGWTVQRSAADSRQRSADGEGRGQLRSSALLDGEDSERQRRSEIQSRHGEVDTPAHSNATSNDCAARSPSPARSLSVCRSHKSPRRFDSIRSPSQRFPRRAGPQCVVAA